MMCRHAALQSILRIIILRCSALSLKATPLSNPTSSWGGLLLKRKLTEGQPDCPSLPTTFIGLTVSQHSLLHVLPHEDVGLLR